MDKLDFDFCIDLGIWYQHSRLENQLNIFKIRPNCGHIVVKKGKNMQKDKK